VAKGSDRPEAALEFFTTQIRKPHTRRAYARAATEFFDLLEAKGITQITEIESVHVATYIEQSATIRFRRTAHLKNGGSLEKAAQVANHARTRTTQLYARRTEEVTLDEVERILV
jgi:hypothetical protein